MTTDGTHVTSIDASVVARLARGARPDGGAGSGVGRLGEALAVRHLEADDGLSVVASNWRLTAGELRGELDVVAVDEARALVVVCEVKARRDAGRFGGAVSAVPPDKRAQVRRLTAAFLREAALPFARVRIDVIAVDLGRVTRLTHLEAAI